MPLKVLVHPYITTSCAGLLHPLMLSHFGADTPPKTYTITYLYLYTICIQCSHGYCSAITEVSVRPYGGISYDCRRVFCTCLLGLIGGIKTFRGCWRGARAKRVRKLWGALSPHNDRPSGARAVCEPSAHQRSTAQRSAVSGQAVSGQR